MCGIAITPVVSSPNLRYSFRHLRRTPMTWVPDRSCHNRAPAPNVYVRVALRSEMNSRTFVSLQRDESFG